MLRQHDTRVRVRYQETDGQGRVHHANFINYFEIGRVELMRACGLSYREMERQGTMLVVAEMHCNYHLPALYDDELVIRTITVKARGARIEHRYEVFRDDELLVTGRSVVAHIDASGRVRRLPDWLQLPAE